MDEFETYNGGLLSSCKVALSPNQDLHGYDSPWVGGAGKNKLDISSGTPTDKAYYQDNKVIITGGTYSNFVTPTITITEAGSITFSTDITVTSGTLNYAIIKNGTQVAEVSATSSGKKTTTINNLAVDDEILIRLRSMDNGQGYFSECQVELGSTATTYEPWDNICPISGHTQVEVEVSDGQTTQEQVTVNLGGTYYSGILDIVSGVFVVDRGYILFDGSQSFTTFGTDGQEFRYDISGLKNSIANLISSFLKTVFPYISWNTSGDSISVVGNGSSLGIRLASQVTSATELKAYFAEHPLQVVYELATPQTIQLTPQQVKALVGENHLSAPLDGQEITESKYRELFTWNEVEAYVNAHSGGGGGVDYSTTEVDTGIKWTDGKPIYMRTFTNVGLPQNAYSATLDLGVEADTIVKIEANDSANAGNATIIFEGVYAKINKTPGSNTILNPTNQLANLTGATLTVYYTKATD